MIAIAVEARAYILYLAVPSGPGNLTIYYSPNDTDTFLGNMQTFTAAHSSLGKHYFDFEFSGKAIQCGDEASCAEVTSMFDWDIDFMSASTQNSYKYLMDTDGNGWSGRFHRLVYSLHHLPCKASDSSLFRLMSTNSMVLKSTIFPEWYSDRIQPWKQCAFSYALVVCSPADQVLTQLRSSLDGLLRSVEYHGFLPWK